MDNIGNVVGKLDQRGVRVPMLSLSLRLVTPMKIYPKLNALMTS
ncbi:hypothetical protein [Candidatus Enterovibrio escicola]|nr:hypothetical protein [Candidatus Enterovibrio escacola]